MDTAPPTILIIEDDPPLRKFLRVIMESADYTVIHSATGEDGLRKAGTEQPDVLILDLDLRDMDGQTVIRRLREWTALPIIALSARNKDHDKIPALDSGADDYVTKPFSVGELLARIRVALRHRAAANPDTGNPVFEVGDLHIDLSARRVTTAGRRVHLTPNEFRLLAVLVKHAGNVLTHRHLLQEVWGPIALQDTHYLRVYMNQLRRKLEKDPTEPAYLLTEPGVGYRFAVETAV